MRTGEAQMTLEGALAGFDPARPDWPGLVAAQAAGAPFALLSFGAGPAEVRRRVPVGLTYLATPYSLEAVDRDGRWCPSRSANVARLAAHQAARLCALGVPAISPVVLADAACRSSQFARGALDPLDAAFWADWCRPLLVASRGVAVPAIRGWARSRGVWAEALWALRRQMPVVVYAPAAEVADGLVWGGLGDG